MKITKLNNLLTDIDNAFGTLLKWSLIMAIPAIIIYQITLLVVNIMTR